jgi:hypothetical protein
MEKPSSYFDWQLSYQENASEGLNRKISDILKRYYDKRTLYKTASLSDSSFNIEKLDFAEGILKCSIEAQDHNNYKILINTKKRTISHECREFKIINTYRKKFCSHLLKLCFILQEKAPNQLISFLEDINTYDYNFFPK